MATMIPDGVFPSEETIFNNLKESVARDWIVFCGRFVNNPANPVRPRELDFVIFMEEDYCSVIYLEAKGGHYIVDNVNMEWYSASSGERIRPNPPTQARTGMNALGNQFSAYFGGNSLISLGCAVAFTDWNVRFSRRPGVLPELITHHEVHDPKKLVQKLADYADKLPLDSVRERLRNNRDYFDTLDLMESLRLEFTRTYMPIEEPEGEPVRITRTHLDTLRAQRLTLTVEQTISLSVVEQSERNVIDGAAGTGKTILAMELAKRHYEAGESVALLCSNSNLSARFQRWVETLPDEGGGRIICGTPATLPLEVLDGEARVRHQQRLKDSPDLEGTLRRGYLDSEWERFIENTVADLGQNRVFDYLIVDEAQNLCDEVFLKLQDALLKRGLIGGRWAMFGDFVNQNLIRDRVEGDGRYALMTWVRTQTNGLMETNWASHTLTVNCRNTQEIADEVARLVRIESPPRTGVHGPLVQIRYYESEADLYETLDGLANSWKDVFQARQMILLSSVNDAFDNSRTYGGWDLMNIRDAEPGTVYDREEVTWVSGDPSPGTLRYSDVYDFQGLESDLAILVLPVTENQVVLAGGVTLPYEEHLNRVLYTGMSRATTMLIIVAHESYRGMLERRRSLYEGVQSGAV